MSPQPHYQADTVDARQLLRAGAIFAVVFGLILALMYLRHAGDRAGVGVYTISTRS